ncbi:DUF7091 family protein [Halorarius halobius]|uniref:DUF7091 family protein n=1 Tax=Halorarius halobius TaxID=2962671 RepID=UPI0020CEDB46|nr:hypothetical protein [Halorarius halobius]
MSNRRRLAALVRQKLRSAGRQYAEAREEYERGKAGRFDLPVDEAGDARIVCRRHAEKRTVAVDGQGRPECFEAGHPDCEGCAEDVREGTVETWHP